MAEKKKTFSVAGFSARLLVSLLLVYSTYNPTGYSFYDWFFERGSAPASLKIVVALALGLLYYALFRIVYSVFRRSGLIVAGLAALLLSLELVSVALPRGGDTWWRFYLLLAQYVALTSIAVVLAFGISWSHILERLTGQLQKHYVRY